MAPSLPVGTSGVSALRRPSVPAACPTRGLRARSVGVDAGGDGEVQRPAAAPDLHDPQRRQRVDVHRHAALPGGLDLTQLHGSSRALPRPPGPVGLLRRIRVAGAPCRALRPPRHGRYRARSPRGDGAVRGADVRSPRPRITTPRTGLGMDRLGRDRAGPLLPAGHLRPRRRRRPPRPRDPRPVQLRAADLRLPRAGRRGRRVPPAAGRRLILCADAVRSGDCKDPRLAGEPAPLARPVPPAVVGGL